MRKILSLELAILLFLAPAYAAQGMGGKSGIGGSAGFGGGVSGGGGVTWTLVQHPSNYTCAATSVTTLACTVPTSATTAGNALLLLSSEFNTGGTSIPTYLSASGDGTWIHCPNSYADATGGSVSASDCAYILSATGGATSITFTWQTTASSDINTDVELLELHRSTGTATLDTTNNSSSTGCSTSCVGPALTLTGASDYIAQWGAFNANPPSALGAPYTNPADVDSVNVYGAYFGALNQSAGTAVTYNQGTADRAAMSALALQ